MWIFIASAISLIPAAGLIGSATDHLAERAGPTLGGFLNATFGNAAELIIAIAALRAHHTAVVKASITGSIIGNLLLVFGLSCVVGGFTHGSQKFNRTSAGTATVMLFLATVALVMPAVVDLVSFGSLQAHPEEIDRLSFWTSIVLLVGLRRRPGVQLPLQPRSAARRVAALEGPARQHRRRADGPRDRHRPDDGPGRGPGRSRSRRP